MGYNSSVAKEMEMESHLEQMEKVKYYTDKSIVCGSAIILFHSHQELILKPSSPYQVTTPTVLTQPTRLNWRGEKLAWENCNSTFMIYIPW